VKVSCLPVSWYKDMLSGSTTLEEWVRFAAALGLDGVDFSIAVLPDRNTARLRRLRRQVEEAGLLVCMIAAYPDFTHPDQGERAHQAEQMAATVDLAKQLGASFVRVTAGQRHPGISDDQGVAWAVAGLRQILAEADDAGVTLVYENHTKGFPWQYSDFSQRSEIFLQILDALANTSLAVNFDTANPQVSNEDPLVLLAAVKARVATVHASDTRSVGVLQPAVIGTGVVPFSEIFRTLKSAGFDGWICIEEASRTGPAGFEQAVAFVRKAWAEA
jgi:sugar phosphate isomerase/epimerase